MPAHQDPLAHLQIHGYTIIPSFLTPSELSTLRAASSALINLSSQGQWPHVRTTGKQFPPWDPSLVPHSAGIWGVQHLLHPSLPLPPDQPSNPFTQLYFSPKLLALSRAILSLPEDDDGDDGLVMELFNLLCKPTDGKGFELSWHRDDIPREASAEEEKERLHNLTEAYSHTQWNLPLYHDSSLILVPGSHLRPRTDVERQADPYEANLEGQVVVELQPGDLVFYDNNILHRGVYSGDKERVTLHGSVGRADGGEGMRKRARNVLQHGVGEWVEQADFSCLETKEREVAEGMRKRLVEMGKAVGKGEVGYSLVG
ncbi:putative nicotinamide N-methyltransferase [Triangularia verruculosa]|uniref:Nicotinamide N-methyltransferase n=1 Tax=Triangularia verruculosa TaxID=2587418 RepID=A0AAN6XJN5_9PEZI|nr:putative nicotinamide N-methyltransferase [Triangularia verruculosa]